MFILEGCHVTTITGYWLEFGGTIHQKNSSLSRHSFNKITFVLPSLLSVTFTSIISNYIHISEIKKDGVHSRGLKLYVVKIQGLGVVHRGQKSFSLSL